MSEIWLTHPGLTPGHDMKVLRASVGTWSGSGWQVREDQSDPVVEVADDVEAAPAPVVEPAPEPPVELAEPDPIPTSSGVTSKKGS